MAIMLSWFPFKRLIAKEISVLNDVRCISTSCPSRSNVSRRTRVPTYTEDAKDRFHTSITFRNASTRLDRILNDDNGRQAVVFDRDVVPKLTPTMKAFTLENKVALVTG